MAQAMAQPASPQASGRPPSAEQDRQREAQGYAPGFGVYPWEPRSFARDPHDPLRNLEEDAENG